MVKKKKKLKWENIYRKYILTDENPTKKLKKLPKRKRNIASLDILEASGIALDQNFCIAGNWRHLQLDQNIHIHACL